ncbi:MAG TPA: hypothetical protein VFK88_05775 [Gallionella sp.]|nr:hypothetical protein [Gallionella sp.]
MFPCSKDRVPIKQAEKLGVKEELGSLRTEIQEAEKARVDFLKWKLIAVAALASFGLSVKDQLFHPAYALCIIPFICIYVDAICAHINLRILVIGKFLADKADPYEKFIADLGPCQMLMNGRGARFLFNMEDYVLWYSTYFLSAVVAFGGIYLVYFKPCNPYPTIGLWLMFAGVLGFVMSLWIQYDYNKRLDALAETDKRRPKSQCDVAE